MDSEQLQKQFEDLCGECRELVLKNRHRSAFRKITEAKRFAKTHGMLSAYLFACKLLISAAGSLHEPDIGIENAVEQIAILESEDKARKFRRDFDPDEYAWCVHHYTAQAYLDLASQTALKFGFNSPLVHGTIDDGIHICRRTNNLAFIDEFRVFANYMAVAAGDYDTAEYYARQAINNSTGEYAEYDSLFGYRTLIWIYLRQGRFNAALQTLDRAALTAKDFEDKNWLGNTFYRWIELLLVLTGRDGELSRRLQDFGLDPGLRERPVRDEDPANWIDFAVNEVVKLILHGNLPEAIERITEEDRQLLANHCLCEWYEIRYKRISLLLMAREQGLPVAENIEELAADLRRRAEKQCHWSVIQTLDSLFPLRVKLNPLGIPFPIDLGFFATPGTPLSQARFDLNEPLDETTLFAPDDVTKKDDAREKSRLELEAESWFEQLEPIWGQLREFEYEKDGTSQEPFPLEAELSAVEEEIYDKIFAHKPGEPITEDEFAALSRSILWMKRIQTPERLRAAWDWLRAFVEHFPRRGRPLAILAYHAFFYRQYAEKLLLDPTSLGLPDVEELIELALKAMELEPNRTDVATTAGVILWSFNRHRDAQRCFARACQLDRLNVHATGSLASLYEISGRPHDALAVYDLYMRAGGRNTGIFREAMQLAFREGKPLSFLLYFNVYTTRLHDDEPIHPMLDAQHIWAFAATGRFIEALDALDLLETKIENPDRDRLFFRALCQAKLDRDDWPETLAAALDFEGEEVRLLGNVFEPCGPLWGFVQKWDAGDPRRKRFEDFLYIRNLLPDSFFLENDDEPGENEPPLKGYFRCVLYQPLTENEPAFAGWSPLLEGVPGYLATWTVLADDEDEATRLAMQAQGRCAKSPSKPVECERLDSFYGNRSQVVYQGRRDCPVSPESVESGGLT